MTERWIVQALNVTSVARVAFGVSLAVWGIAFVGLVALYLLGLVSGGLGGVEGFIASLGFTGFRLSILPFLGVFVVVGGLASAVTAVAAGVLAHLYNALRPLVGGVEVDVEERAARSAAPPPTQRHPPTVPTPPVPTPPTQPSPPRPPAPPPPATPDVHGGIPRPGP